VNFKPEVRWADREDRLVADKPLQNAVNCGAILNCLAIRELAAALESAIRNGMSAPHATKQIAISAGKSL
jgi:hypothetical protein